MVDVARGAGFPHWEFVPKPPMAKHRDPIQAEFFNTDSIRGAADEVVREAVQNTLDAQDEDSAGVRVRIYVSGVNGALAAAEAAAYFSGIWAHAEECGIDGALRHQPCQFVVVEDFGTTGLIGDETSYEPPLPSETNHFFYFFRAEGKSGKSGSDRGRWGVGKYVFPNASGLKSFFAVTVRKNGVGSSGPLLMGQAVMKNHSVNGKTWEPDGYWADFDTAEVPVPVQDSDVLESFRETWSIERQDEPGLSVVVPYVDAELDADELRRSVVRDYFAAVLEGRLTVQIDRPAGDSLVVSSDTLDEVISNLPSGDERDHVMRDTDLVRWAFDPSTEAITIEAPSGSPEWGPELISDETAQEIRDAIDSGRRALIRVPLTIEKLSGGREEGFFEVLLSPEANHRRSPLFIREGIIVSEVWSKVLPGIRAIVLAQGGWIAELLGDAEGPAHTNWSSRTERFKGKYKYGAKWLTFVRHSPGKILDRVRGEGEEEDRALAAHYFSIPDDGEGRGEEADQDAGSDVTPPPVDPPGPPKPQKVVVRRTANGGFCVRLTEAGSGVTFVDVSAAYSRSKGNPFRKWSSADFNVTDLDVQIAGGRVVNRNGNRIVAEVEDASDFALQVVGFDVKRDLRVRATSVGAGTT